MVRRRSAALGQVLALFASGVLVRNPSLTDPMFRVGGGARVTGVTVQNLTVCGNGSIGSHNGTVCPAPVPTTCNTWTVDSQTDPTANTCADLSIENAYYYTPPNIGATYSVTLQNVDFENATGHAIAIYPNAGVGQSANDIHVNGITMNSPRVTGILLGANFTGSTNYADRKVCDSWLSYHGHPFADDPNVPFPRNIVIENSTFTYSLTGVIAGTARRTNVQNNTFTGNFLGPTPL